MRGVLLMIGSMAAFTFNDTALKTLADEVPLFQAIFLRGMLVSAGLFVIALALGQFRLDLSRQDWNMIGLRTFGEIGATASFLYALFNLPIANVTAILQATPLVMTLAGAVLLGEKVGWRRWVAILVGFFGVMLIVRPFGEGFSPYSLSVLAALVFILIRDIPTRKLSPNVPSLMVALSAAVVITAMGAVVTATKPWVPVSSDSTWAIFTAAGFILVAYVLAVKVMRVGEIAVVQPFRYTAILWAILMGILVFGEYPDFLTIIGAGIVVGMGVYTFYRERKVKETA